MNYLNDHSAFNSTDELNAAVYLHIRNNTHLLNESDRSAIKLISRYAVKYTGVAHLKAKTIARLIDRSEKTARRIIKKLCELQIIQKVHTLRTVSGGKGANILAFLPAEERIQNVNNDVKNNEEPLNDQSDMSTRGDDENATAASTETRKNETEPSYSFNHLTITSNTDTLPPVPSSALRSAMPHAVYTVMSPFFNAEELYKYYGILLKAKRKNCPSTLIEHNPEPYVEAFNATMLKVKQGVVHDLESYLYSAFEKAAGEVDRLDKMSDIDDSVAKRFKDVMTNVS